MTVTLSPESSFLTRLYRPPNSLPVPVLNFWWLHFTFSLYLIMVILPHPPILWNPPFFLFLHLTFSINPGTVSRLLLLYHTFFSQHPNFLWYSTSPSLDNSFMYAYIKYAHFPSHELPPYFTIALLLLYTTYHHFASSSLSTVLLSKLYLTNYLIEILNCIPQY